jgi:hypothetical protein
MKKLVYILSIMLLVGCKAFDASFLQSGEFALSNKLPAMEKEIENNYMFVVSQSGRPLGPSHQDISVLFDKELSEKITNPYTDKKGIMVLKVNTVEHKSNPGIALFIPIVGVLTGLPTQVSKSNIEVQIDVLNQNRKLIGRYNGYSNKKMRSSIYKNAYADPSRVVYLQCVKEAIQQAKKIMEADAERLKQELNG